VLLSGNEHEITRFGTEQIDHSINSRNVSILPHHYTASQTARP
jgi:hypothetical protein